MKTYQKVVAALTLAAVTSSCAILPVTTRLHKWTAESCGRSSFITRVCSGIVIVVTSPLYAFTFLIDMPLSLYEFFTGDELVDDPLIAEATFEKRVFAGKNGDSWEVQPVVAEPGRYEVTKAIAGQVIEKYSMRKLPGGELEVRQLAI